MRFLFLLTLCLLFTLPTAAQQNEPGAEVLTYDSEVSESIANDAIFDWWLLEGSAGDVLVVDMRGENGLAPLIGLLDPGGNLIARSEDGEANSTVTMEYTLPESGQYTIVATRAGNERGTTTGDYTLRVRRANNPVERVTDYQQVTFRCADYEVTNVATLEFSDPGGEDDFYRISVYGLDGFVPVIRVYLSGLDLEDCARDPLGMEGDTVTLPGEDTITVTGDQMDHSAQLTISGTENAGTVTLTIGSREGVPGRYIAVVEGFSIQPRDNVDFIRIGQGPRTTGTPLLMYMIGGKNERLDPSVLLDEADSESESEEIICDDAGRRGCEDVPSAEGLRITLRETVEIVGDRFDAGMLLPEGSPRLQQMQLYSFGGNTEGTYSLVLLGELPGEG